MAIIRNLSENQQEIAFTIARGHYADDEFKLENDCQMHIQDCCQQLAKHRIMTVVDGISLLLDALNGLEKK